MRKKSFKPFVYSFANRVLSRQYAGVPLNEILLWYSTLTILCAFVMLILTFFSDSSGLVLGSLGCFITSSWARTLLLVGKDRTMREVVNSTRFERDSVKSVMGDECSSFQHSVFLSAMLVSFFIFGANEEGIMLLDGALKWAMIAVYILIPVCIAWLITNALSVEFDGQAE